MPGHDHVRTERLDLTAVRVEDAPEAFAFLSDPLGWWFAPQSRHQELATTERFCERAAARWPSDGLSYWAVRRRDDGSMIGIGGVQRHRTHAWNLSYRLAGPAQGHGFAVEFSRAAVIAAAQVDPNVPIIAWILEENAPSRRVADQLGLINYGPQVDANDGVLRLAYADRPIERWISPSDAPPERPFPGRRSG